MSAEIEQLPVQAVRDPLIKSFCRFYDVQWHERPDEFRNSSALTLWPVARAV
jgi:hypothetical protein